jgi:hypothetical protein
MLAIIGKNDKVLFSIAIKGGNEITSYQQFKIHASLDLIEQKSKTSTEQ